MEKTLESSSWKDKVNLPTVGSLFLCLKQQSVGPLNDPSEKKLQRGDPKR